MCTAVTLRSGQGEHYFGRTMDFSFDIEPSLYRVGGNYAWRNVIDGDPISDRYGFLAIGQESEGLLAFFDGVNERGFAAAALYFAGYAQYDAQAAPGKAPVASVDFLHYILGKCGSVEDLEELLQHTSLIGLRDPVTETVAPLHWIAADKSGNCAVVEQTAGGLELFRNPIGVLANSPDFPWQMTNLRNYRNVSPGQAGEVVWGGVPLSPFGQGAGTTPLPGGYTSPERFVRTAYLKTHLPVPQGRAETVTACFHVMDGVTIPRGAVLTDRGAYDYTKYVAFMNTDTGEYFFRTYDNSQIAAAGLWENGRPGAQAIRLFGLNRPVVFDKI